MCGISGYLGFETLGEDPIDATLEAMNRRGPDSKGLFIERTGDLQCALLFSRLSIIDLDSRSNQPFGLDRYQMVFNGEIYNYKELKKDLQGLGHVFRTESDTEVLLTSFIQYGPSCVEKFEGMWAFAIYDKTDGSLFLSRDRFGEKPLYIHHSDKGFFFASEVKFLRTLSGVKFAPNFKQINRYLTNGYRSLYKGEDTFFENISEIQPGENWTVNSKLRISKEKYWVPRFKPRAMTYEEALSGVKDRLLDSIKIRLRSDVPLAFCLSGGVDSSAIVSIASKIFGSDVSTFSIIDQDKRYNEYDNIMATVNDIGCEHKSIFLEKETSLDGLRRLVNYHDSPVSTISYYIHSFLSREMAASGFRVSFSGTGADELLTGYYDHFHMHLYEMRDHPSFPQLLQDWKVGIGKSVRNPFLQDPELFIKNREFRTHIYNDPEEFKNYLHVSDDEPFTESNYSPSLLRNRMMNELFHEGTRLILHEDDLNSMYYSIENRSPYLDRRLFDHCFSIPHEYLIKNGQGKHLLREATKGILNDQVRLDTQKKGFNASIFSIIDFKADRVKEDLLSDSSIFELVNRNKIEELFSKDHLENSGSKFLFSFVSAKLFLESIK